jgi:hypothetical protein
LGATVGQLPELSTATTMEGIKTYPDQPVLKEDKQNDSLKAIREEKIAFIPSKPGEFRLPDLEVSWFNTKTQKFETARLPSVTIHALASNDAAQAPAEKSAEESPVAAAPIVTTVLTNIDIRIWQGLSAFLAIGWLATLVTIYLRHPKLPPSPTTEKKLSGTLSESALEKNLKRACWDKNPQTVKQLLLVWGKEQFGAENLDSIAKKCSQPLSGEIQKLNTLLYSKTEQHWSGESLWQAFSTNSIEIKLATAHDDGLEPLYKI